MKAMILAAGRGTRLKPLTNYKPKALVKVNDTPLLEVVMRQLISKGFDDFVVNLHHFGDQIQRFLEKKDNFGARVTFSDERDELLDTGGAIKHARSFFDGEPFLLMNTDILTDLDFKAFYQAHLDSKAMVSLAVRSRSTSRYLVVDEKNRLSGWANVKEHLLKISRPFKGDHKMVAFSGIHIIDPAIFGYFPKRDIFSIIDFYLSISDTIHINAYPHDQDRWLDVGKIETLEQAEPFARNILEKIESAS